jgi:hypothetical protein
MTAERPPWIRVAGNAARRSATSPASRSRCVVKIDGKPPPFGKAGDGRGLAGSKARPTRDRLPNTVVLIAPDTLRARVFGSATSGVQWAAQAPGETIRILQVMVPLPLFTQSYNM